MIRHTESVNHAQIATTNHDGETDVIIEKEGIAIVVLMEPHRIGRRVVGNLLGGGFHGLGRQGKQTSSAKYEKQDNNQDE